MLRFSGVAASHTGLVREGNEDSGYLGATCMLVADGVGGAAAGEVASATTAYVVSTLVLNEPQSDPLVLLAAGIRLAQEQVAAGVVAAPAREGMATTLTAVATDGQRFGLAHLGDSRGYLFREGRLSRVTKDHSYVQRLVDEGKISEPEAAVHPWRNVVLRSVNGTVAEPGQITELDLRAGDRVLLASDGLTDLVDDREIASVLARHVDDVAVQALVDAALAAGGVDNVTCLLATVVEGEQRAAEDRLVGAVVDADNIVSSAVVRMPRTA